MLKNRRYIGELSFRHKSYNIIIDLARKYSCKVRYFAYASATKCAEQVVEKEENAVK